MRLAHGALAQEVEVVPTRQAPPMLLGRDAELAWCAEGFARRRVLAIFGLAGIGKTSLLLTAAHAQARRVAGTVAYHSCAEGDRISEVLASLLSCAHPAQSRITPLRAALDEVVAWAERTPLVLCIDDSHRMSDPLLLDVLSHLGAAAAPIWLALASRRQLPLPEVDINGEILRLGPLSVESARALWDDLEQRFGPSVVRFDLVDAAHRGSPFALRQAFATGHVGAGDVVALTGLAPQSAALLAQICAFEGPVDADRLAAFVPHLMAALPALLQMLLVEVTWDRAIMVHDLVRAAVARSTRPPSVAEHEVCRQFYAASGSFSARLRHAVGAEAWSEAAELIEKVVRPHYGFFPMGAAVERQVLDALAALDSAHVTLSLPLRLARLQLSARSGQGHAVLEVLRNEVAHEPAAWAHLGAVELLLGDARAAEAHFRQALASPSIVGGPLVHGCLLGLMVEVLRTQGNIEAAHAVQQDFERVAAQLGPIGVAVAQVVTAAMFYDQERYEEASSRLASARPCIALLTLAPSLQGLHALLERVCNAALARSPDNGSPTAAITRALFEDVEFIRATLLLFAAEGDMLEGDAVQAEARARDVEAITDRVGYRGIHLWARYVRVECLRMRGLAAAAVELAAQVLREPLVAVHGRQRLLLLAASARSLAQLGRMEDARAQVGSLDVFTHAPITAARLSILPWIKPHDLTSDLARVEFALAQFELALTGGQLDQAVQWSEAADLVRSSTWHYLRARLAVLDAELAVRMADACRAEQALGEAEGLCSERGYRRQHAVAALIAVAAARMAADRDGTRYWAGVAAERAAGISADIEATAATLLDGLARPAPVAGRWMERLDLAAPRLFRLREPGGVRFLTKRQAEAIRFAADTFGVDTRQQTVRSNATTLSLASRPGLRSVLSALLTSPGLVISPDAIARHAWGVGYDPRLLRSRLVVSIRRLRNALGGDVIISVDGGYRLHVHSWAVLEPIDEMK
jgi:RecA/RadA recombinase